MFLMRYASQKTSTAWNSLHLASPILASYPDHVVGTRLDPYIPSIIFHSHSQRALEWGNYSSSLRVKLNQLTLQSPSQDFWSRCRWVSWCTHHGSSWRYWWRTIVSHDQVVMETGSNLAWEWFQFCTGIGDIAHSDKSGSPHFIIFVAHV